MKLKAIFRDIEYFTITDSFNPKAAQLFDDNSEEFFKRVQYDCEKSSNDFDNHYENCPYKHKKQEVPEEVMKVLKDTNKTSDEKKSELKLFFTKKCNEKLKREGSNPNAKMSSSKPSEIKFR